MENVSPETIWFVSGLVVSAAMWLLRRFKTFDVAPAAIKQATAAVFSMVINIALPVIMGKDLPPAGMMVAAILTTFTSALSTYSIAKTVTGARNAEK